MSKQIKLPTLLIVTDNPSVRFWLKKHLDEQFFVISAETRQETLEALSARLDFIILDAAFEECEALDLCGELSQRTKKQIVPILLITGRLKKSFRDEAMQAGVTDFLSDQLDLDELQLRIKAGMKHADVRQKTEELGLSIKMPKVPAQTSLKKKVALTPTARKFFETAKKEQFPAALLALRIDGLEKREREEIREELCQFIQQFLRKTDLLFPSEIGATLLFPHTALEIARKAAEKLQKNIAKHPFTAGNLTVSIAIASLTLSQEDFHKQLERALHSLEARSETNFIIFLDQETE